VTDALPGGNWDSSLVLLGGCFWGLDRALARLPSMSTRAGYAGGASAAAPTYYDLDRSGHSEAVPARFDPSAVTLEQVLEAFAAKSASDPSPPGSPRYRRAVLCVDEAQAAAARRLRDASAAAFAVEWRFHDAEPYHQRYYDRVLGPE
jgi:peptide methionine sulfoxide reductase MsrA